MKCKILFLLYFLLTAGALSAQDSTVSGVVSSADDGLPLPGATVVVVGTTISTGTDMDGNFTLKGLTGNETLEVSYIGYVSQSISIANRNVINVILATDSQRLDEVVVTGYSSQRRVDITGAVAVVDMEELNKQAEPNPLRALQGRVAGVKVSSDGSPSGSNTSVLIRGVGTLGNTAPLLVIDGVPTKSGLHELNPNDIESMQILKDAASASIYGSRASNGVIVITTKKGKAGKMRLNFSNYSSFSSYANRLEVLNAEQYGQVLWQANINDGLNPNNNNLSYQFDWGVVDGTPTLNNVLVPQYLDAAQTLKASNTDWYDAISRQGIAQSYDLSVANGSEKGNYFFSLGLYDNQGIVKTTEFKRLSARINTSYKFFNNKLTIGQNLSINRTNEVTDPGVLDPALRALPLIPVRTVDGIGWGGPVGGMNDRQNPYRLLEYNKDNGYSYLRLFGNAYAELELLKGLTVRSNFGMDYGSYYKRTLQRSYVSGYLQNDQNAVNIDQSVSDKWTWTNSATYKFDAGKSSFNVFAATEMYSEDFRNTWLRREGFLIENPDYMFPDAGTGEAFNGGSSTNYTLLSYFGKVDYDYDNKYLLSALVRYDGSSRFGPNNQFGTFPAFSAGWRISEEQFIKNKATFVSDLKLRVGWGQTGNQEISNTAIYALYLANYAGGNPTWDTSYGTAYDLAGNGNGLLNSGFIAIQSANDNLKWETTTQTNVGLDFGFFDQKLTGSAEYYFKDTKDILVLPPYLGTIGEGGNQWINGASMENKGWEFTLNYSDQTTYGLKYDVSANFSTNKNKITHLPASVRNNYGGNGTDDNILGRPINSMYGYVADGLFRTEDQVFNSAEQPGKGLGRIRYRDLNGDNVINDQDRQWIGNPNPDFAYGFNVALGYQNFDFTMFFEGIGNVDVINQTKYQTDFWSVDDVGSNKGKRLLNAWSPSNPNSTIPALTTNDTNAESRFSTYYIENGRYLKLRVLQLGYSLPKETTQRLQMDNFRIYVSGQNLWTLTAADFTGVDPENAGFGYPQPLTFNVGVNISL